ncbi:hypothetical protein B0H19DRAFT_1377091 [Mycena capillaripes]|nr:hypothetical protein B0H19DRAFT_1377091 [Mycena capillaripes]
MITRAPGALRTSVARKSTLLFTLYGSFVLACGFECFALSHLTGFPLPLSLLFERILTLNNSLLIQLPPPPHGFTASRISTRLRPATHISAVWTAIKASAARPGRGAVVPDATLVFPASDAALMAPASISPLHPNHSRHARGPVPVASVHETLA